MREYALVLLVTAAVTYLLVPLVRRVAVATHAIHAPRARDVHTEPTPLLGGLAMYGGLVAGLLFASRLSFLSDPFQAAGSRTQAGLLLAGGLIVIVGFIDDRWGLSAISKLAGQVAAAGILVWSGQSLPWLPTPNGHIYVLEQDLSVTLTILLVVVTINAINFIDGLDGLAAGVVAVAALGFLAYSYTLGRTLQSTGQSLPAVSSAVLAGMCLGFLPHNFFPARIFMGDIGAMLLGLMLAYGPISSSSSLDPALLSSYAQNHPFNRFPAILPLLVPVAIFLIPYADLLMAVARRIRRRKPVMVADREHLHHRLLSVGHSYRQSVLIMWLWAALFSATVVSLSIVRTHLIVLVAITIVAMLALLPVTMPRLRPWRMAERQDPKPVSRPRVAPRGVAIAPGVAPAAAPAVAPMVTPAGGPPVVTPAGGLPARPRDPAPASSFAPPSFAGAGPAPSRGGAGRGSARSGPPPGFEPLSAPTVGEAYPTNGLANGRSSGSAGSGGNGRANDDANSRGNGAGRADGQDNENGFPFPGPAEHALRPFPGTPDSHPHPFATQDPFGTPNPFATQAPFTSPPPFSTSDPFSNADPFATKDPFSNTDPFGASESFSASDPFGAPDPFGGPDGTPLPRAGRFPDDD
jgi:UDP-GlcNAc:undecaprenyl-phosphate/decaprenyl-phosphate GlcNAc-1-phosphate transferase